MISFTVAIMPMVKPSFIRAEQPLAADLAADRTGGGGAPSRRRDIVFVVNPRGANGRTGKEWKKLLPYLRSRLSSDCNICESLTSGPCHAIDITREAIREGADAVVAVGGDGTLHEVVNGFFWGGKPVSNHDQSGHTTALGVSSSLCLTDVACVPYMLNSYVCSPSTIVWNDVIIWKNDRIYIFLFLNGLFHWELDPISREHLAGQFNLLILFLLGRLHLVEDTFRHLNANVILSLFVFIRKNDPRDAVERISRGMKSLIDVGAITGDGKELHYFLNVADIHLSAKAGYYASRYKKFGNLCYVIGALQAFFGHHNQDLRIKVDDGEWEVYYQVTALCIGNAKYFGGGMKITPNAHPCSRNFEVVALQDFKWYDFILKLHKLYNGTHLSVKNVSSRSACTIEVEEIGGGGSGSGSGSIYVQSDGEYLGFLPRKFTILGGAIHMIC